MGIFDKLKEPIILKEDSEAEKQLEILKGLRPSFSGEQLDRLEREIKLVEAGIAGEQAILFELKNSHMPMYVLHDLFLEHDGLSAQIDFLVIARRYNYLIECKNLYGDIEIDSEGRFTRTIRYKNRYIKEGIYSPITQNTRHLDLIRTIKLENSSNVLLKAAVNHGFSTVYKPIVVLANPKTVLNDRNAKDDIKKQVIRADQLIEYIKKTEKEKGMDPASDKLMEEAAMKFLNISVPNNTDYTKKFREMIESEEKAVVEEADKITDTQVPLCPKCGAKMVLRTATRGQNVGNQFYGCSNYPKCRGIVNITSISM